MANGNSNFTVVFDGDGNILQVTPPDGQTIYWPAARALGEYPENVSSIVVPFEILKTTTGLTCVHSGCRKICW
jgi:hypothetical protein